MVQKTNFLRPKRFEVRRSCFDTIIREMCTEDLDEAINLFLDLVSVKNYLSSSSPTETLCVWDTSIMNVVYHDKRYLTTPLLKEK